MILKKVVVVEIDTLKDVSLTSVRRRECGENRHCFRFSLAFSSLLISWSALPVWNTSPSHPPSSRCISIEWEVFTSRDEGGSQE